MKIHSFDVREAEPQGSVITSIVAESVLIVLLHISPPFGDDWANCRPASSEVPIDGDAPSIKGLKTEPLD